ncbi:Cyclic GMP-AMP synthase [Larimichthys crocea]|uniref:Cyclic GMP-AMP synthase n=1 Tax=Larimichthys crocea TaxID=215358 RepID=A0A6G0HPP3_LARCR|nr:Cyclic GMP-AMP synthase [Larimichthys crocea]
MTGRGRPRKAKSPDIKTNQGRSPGKDVTEVRQNGTTREQKPKEQRNRNRTKGKPCVQSPQKEDRNHCKEVGKLQRTPTEASVPGAKTKTQTTKDCLMATEAETHGKQASPAKSPDKASEKQQDAPSDTTEVCVPQINTKHCTENSKLQRIRIEAPLQGAKAKTCAGTTEQSAEEMTEIQPETPKNTTKAFIKTPKAKTGGGKAKSPEKIKDKAPRKQQDAPNDTTEVCVPQINTKHCVENGKLQRIPIEAPVQGAKAKTCVGTTEQSAEERKMQPETPKDTTKALKKTPKGKKGGGKAKSPGKIKDKAPKKQQDGPNDTTEVCVPQINTKHCVENGKLQRIPIEAPVRGAKAKTCVGTTEQSAEEMTKMQPETPKDTTKALKKTPKGKKGGGKAKSPGKIKDKAPKKQQDAPNDTTEVCVPQINTKHCVENGKLQRIPIEAPVRGAKAKTCVGTTEQSAEEMTKMQPETTKDTTKALKKTPNRKKGGGKAKSPEKIKDKAPKKQQDAPNDTTEVCVPQVNTKHCVENGKLQRIHIEAPVQGAKAKTCAGTTEQSAEQITKIQPETQKETTKAFIKTPKAKTGGGKVKSPEKIKDKAPKKQQGAPKETPKVRVPHVRCKENTAVDSILSKTLKKLKIRSNERSDASEVINKIIKDIIMYLKQNTVCFKEVEEPLRTGSYYENLKISNPDEFDVMLPIPVGRVDIKPFGEDGAFYSVALKRGRSPLQKFQEDSTLSASKMLQEFRDEVKKSVKGFEDIWRVSFSHIEKAILMNHGSEKTCCEKDGARCCRKDCLKLLKHLLGLLKERDSSFDKFCSYHVKTTLLRACCSRTKDSDWSDSGLGRCFQLLLEDFVAHLKSGKLYNFFIPTQNLLSGPSQRSCNSLAHCMEEERDKGFPIFK